MSQMTENRRYAEREYRDNLENKRVEIQVHLDNIQMLESKVASLEQEKARLIAQSISSQVQARSVIEPVARMIFPPKK